MAYLIQKNCVLIECICGSLKPITKTYLCRYCLKIRCVFCINHEIDSSFCSSCMQSLPPGEARLKKNRCSSCLDCPSCFQTLSLRGTSAGRTSSAEDSASKSSNKHFYLSCSFCRWTTRDVDLPDQTVAVGGWPEREHLSGTRITELIEYYKAVALRDLKEKDKKTGSNRRSYHTYHILGLTQTIARKKAGLPPLNFNRDVNISMVPRIVIAEASENVEQLPPDIFSKPVDVSKITTLPQRLICPEFQPELCSDFYPIRKHLIVRRSARCWICEHNVVKPEIHPTSVKYKLKLLCFYHMPEVRIMSIDPLHAGVTSNVVLKFINPFEYKTTVKFQRLKKSEEDIDSNDQDVPIEQISKIELSDKLEFGRLKKVKITGDINIYEQVIVLQPKDDSTDFDDSVDLLPIKSDVDLANVPLWTKNNKAAVKLKVTPQSELNVSDEVAIGFSMVYSYMNSVAPPETPQDIKLSANVFLILGNIESN